MQKRWGFKAISDWLEWGGLNVFIKKFRGVSSLIVRYILRHPLAKMGKAIKQYSTNNICETVNPKFYNNFMLILLLFVYLKHHYFVQLSHLYLTGILFAL